MPDAYQVLKMPTSIWLESEGKQFVTGKVLDVGCGNKPYKRIFPECEWVGLDNRPVAEIVADAHKMPLEDDSFDTVLCTEMLHLAASPVLVMRECARVVKPGGFILVSTPNVSLDDDSTLWGIKRRGLDYLFASASLKGVMLGSTGRFINNEWADFQSLTKYQMSIPEVGGWLSHMDERYPCVTLGVARKE